MNHPQIVLGLTVFTVGILSIGQEWNVQVQITPVMPKLIKGVLFQ